MRSLTIVAVSLCALAALRPVDSSGAESKLVFVHQGVERVATLFHPATLPYGPAPIVLALHGRNQTIESLHEWLHL
ncbi:MAG: hypothetical protein ACXWJ5_14855, partial [Xanthobacteraceae bacterium]